MGDVNLDEIQSLLPPEVLKSHPNRQRDWYVSRLALIAAFKSIGESKSFIDLVFHDYQRLSLESRWKFSLAHTDSCGCAWVVPSGSLLGLGVDVENRHRELSVSLQKSLKTKDDISLDAISLWNIKEAAFKSLGRETQGDVTLSKIVATQNRFSILGFDESGTWQQQISGDFLQAFAWRTTGD